MTNQTSAAELPSVLPRRRRLSAPSPITALADLLTHTMPGVGGSPTRATSLLFVPHGTAPDAGWPLLAWIHGTTTGGAPDRAPSLSATLDGNLTADGYVTGYVDVIDQLTRAGFAVVAPDLEGLGPEAEVPHPYFDAGSLARSVTSAVIAAYQLEPSLAPAWAVVGHSEGGHGALVTERYAEDVADAAFVGTVAFAPLTSVSGIVAYHGDRAIRCPADALDHVVQQNFNVALMAAGLRATHLAFDLSTLMGADLAAVMPALTSKGSVGIVADIADSVRSATIVRYRGFTPDWNLSPIVRGFLERSDPALIPEFSPQQPTLILQGSGDVSVPEHITSSFVRNLSDRAAQIDYRCFPDVDHFEIVPIAMPAALRFLHEQFVTATR